MTDKKPLGLMPYITVKGASRAIAFYVKAFGAKEEFRLNDTGDRIGHAELTIGDGKLALSDEYPDFGALSPPSIGGTAVKLHLYVADVDATMKKAEAAGAAILRPAADQFYGDRSGMIADPFGHHWLLATRKEEVSPKEMQKRFTDLSK